MKNARFSAVLSVLIIVALTLSFCFVIAESDHDCAGEDCHVCRAIAAAVETVVKFSVAAALVFAVAPHVIPAAAAAFARLGGAVSDTPVALKVKLSN